MTTTFARLGLPKPIVAALDRRGIAEAFPIQAAAIPDALEGVDVCGKAPTGSGKTLAFGLPLLARVEQGTPKRPRALVLAPTRELATQITHELAPYGKAAFRRLVAVYGGVGYGHQKSALRRGVDVVVATPGRLEDLIQQNAIRLDEIDMVVVDEADRMADMGFLPAVRRILDATPRGRQTLLFSATLDGDIAVLSREYQRNPVTHEAESVATTARPADHRFWLVDPHDRIRHTADVIAAEGRSIVFTRTRHGADRLAKQLGKLGVDATVLHGGRSQNQRTKALDAFSRGRVAALIATDVAARGIHVEDVAAVVHYDVAGDAKDYVHRSGRTGRAGRTGKVVTLVADKQRRGVEKMARELELDVVIERPGTAAVDRTPVEHPRVPAHRSETGRAKPAVSHPDRPRKDRAKTDRPTPDRVAKDRPNGGRSASVYVANLPWSVTSDELRTVFSPYGAVHDSTVVTDRRSGRSRGFGFVALDPAGAERAVQQLNGSSLGGRSLTVRPARPSSSAR